MVRESPVHRVIYLVIPVVGLSFASLAADEPDLPSADQCRKWASVRLGSDEGPTDFAVAATMRGAKMFNFDALTARWGPDRAMGFVVDPSDGTPVMASFGSDTIVYLAAKGMVFRIPKSNLQSLCRIEDDNLSFVLAAPSPVMEIDVALGTILAKATLDVRISRNVDTGTVSYDGTSLRGSPCHSLFDPKQRIPLREMHLKGRAADDPSITIHQSVWQAPLPNGFLDFPLKALEEHKVPLKIIEERSPSQTMTLSMGFGSSLIVRQAIRNPDLRESVGKTVGIAPKDWEDVVKKDADISMALREILSSRIHAVREAAHPPVKPDP